jgi:hypothetical protein
MQFAHGAARLHLVCMHGTRESFMGITQLEVAFYRKILQSKLPNLKCRSFYKSRPTRETGGLRIFASEQIAILCSGVRQNNIALRLLAIARKSTVVCALLISSLLSATNLNAEESQAAICAEKIRGFVESIDELLTGNANDVYVFREPIRKYMPAKGCSVEEVISISRTSKFFVQAYDWSPAYTIIFRNSRFDITFGLRKDTGNIEYPAAQTRLPTR